MTLEEKMRGVQDVISLEILKRLHGTFKVGERVVFDFLKEPSDDFPFYCMQLPAAELGYTTPGDAVTASLVPEEYYTYKSNAKIIAGKPITDAGKNAILRWALLGVGFPGYKMAYRNGSSADWLAVPVTELRTGVWTGDTDGGVQYHYAYPHRSAVLVNGQYQTKVVHLREPYRGSGYVYEYMGGI